MQGLGIVAFAMLAVLPGAWLAFGLRLPGVSAVARLLLAVVASPIVLIAQFYLLRWTGVSFEATAVALPLLNVPAAALIWRNWSLPEDRPSAAQGVLMAAAWLAPVAFVLFFIQDAAAHATSAHTFIHLDIVYAIVGGALRPEEAQLAGLSLTYPWGGHVHQAVLSWHFGNAPVANYIWTNAVLMVGAVGLLTLATGRLGGSFVSRVATVAWILFSVSAVGYTLMQFVASESFTARYPIWGDWSIHPWMRKYTLWNQHPHAHGFLAGLVYLMVGRRSESLSWQAVVLSCVLIAGLGLVYPIFVPAAFGVMAGRFLVDAFPLRDLDVPDLIKKSLIPATIVVVVGGLLTLFTLDLVGENRATGTGVVVSDWWRLRVKTVTTLIAFAPLLLGGALLLPRLREHKESAIPLIGGLLTLALFVLFTLEDGALDYKFMHAAAICLAPCAAIGIDRFLGNRGQVRLGIYALSVLFVVGAGVDRMMRYRAAQPSALSAHLDVEAFDLGLRDHALTDPLAAIASDTPDGVVVVVDSVELHVPAFIRRPLYAPSRTESILAGVGMKNEEMVGRSRGYGREVVRARQAVVRDLFRSEDEATRLRALDTIHALDRPLAFLLRRDQHDDAIQTLGTFTDGRVLFQDSDWIVWLATPNRAGSQATPPDADRPVSTSQPQDVAGS